MKALNDVVERKTGSQLSKNEGEIAAIAIAGRGGRATAFILQRFACDVDRHYARVRLEDRAELLRVERNGCKNGLELHHQVWMALGNILPCRFVFEELGEIPFRKH
ncbi:hypothetical protein P3T43_005376 [Paraburkholderia sp. GAS41]|jgi:hypothetical protein